jgi:hypothetical protein
MSGTFRMQAGGPGGTVKYSWVYKDNATTVTHSGSIVVAAGDTAPHYISDSYVHPNSAGTAYLVFTSPWYASTGLQQSWTCR